MPCTTADRTQATDRPVPTVRTAERANAPGKANSAAPQLAFELGGSPLLGIAFATILAVVAGLTITTSATVAHDLYNQVFKRGTARSHLGDRPDRLQPRGVRQAGRRAHREEPVDAAERRLPPLPAGQPGSGLDPARIPPGYIGTVTSKEFNRAKYAEMEMRSLTGHGVAEAIEH